jgi:SSS family solute:Na+ symporter
MVAPFVAYGYVRFFTTIRFPESLFYIVAFTTTIWLVTTYATKPTNEEKLLAFYRRIHPGGIFWRRIAEKLPEVKGDSHYLSLFIDWVAGIVVVYSVLFGIGKLIFSEYTVAIFFFIPAVAAAGFISWDLRRRSA